MICRHRSFWYTEPRRHGTYCVEFQAGIEVAPDGGYDVYLVNEGKWIAAKDLEEELSRREAVAKGDTEPTHQDDLKTEERADLLWEEVLQPRIRQFLGRVFAKERSSWIYTTGGVLCLQSRRQS